jgi:hypothetical protein
MSFPPTDTGLRLSDASSFITAISQFNSLGVGPARTPVGTNQATALAISQSHPIWEATTTGAGTGIQLPLSNPGKVQIIANAGANTLQVYTNVNETAASPKINATAGATGVGLTTGKNAIFFCTAFGQWYMILTA